VNFSDTSTGSPTSWAWNFGDGDTSSTRNPSHTYTAAGTYTVRLTARNAAGSDSSTRTITVNPAVDSPSPTSPTAHSISGPADIVAAGSDGVLWNYPADGNGGLQPRVKIGAGWGGLKNGFVTDWNQDGVFDVIAQWKDGRMSYYAGKAAGGLAAGQTIGSGWSNFHVTVGRWRKADRYPSVVAYDAAGALWHYPNNTGKTFGSRAKIGIDRSGLYLTMAGYNRRRAQDILAERSDGSLMLYRSTGVGSFPSGTHPDIGNGWNSINSITKLEGHQGTGTSGLMGPDSRLAYYPILNGIWGTRTLAGSGWGPHNIFR
ncbi:MAG: PKD domain-containing protein, partial [Actinomycetota bacterium]|nr:PKD domain-containing protein [Actinomycetota bacterium]